MDQQQVTLLGVDKIRPTEQTSAHRVNTLFNEIRISGVWTHPVLVDDTAHAIMDGHHRFAAARRMNLAVVPVAVYRYADPSVRLGAWRSGENYTPAQVREIARKGTLLPPKSIRHIIDGRLPRCRVPLDALTDPAACGTAVDAATPQPSRAQMLTPYYHALGRRMGLRTGAAEAVDIETAETLAPHMRLRHMLQTDPAMAALLPAAAGRIALGDVDATPFFLRASGLLLLPPTLLEDPAALAIAARWGLEASRSGRNGPPNGRQLVSVLRQGAALVAAAPERARNLLLDTLPEKVGRELCQDGGACPSAALLAWQAGRIEAATTSGLDAAEGYGGAVELEAPSEVLLVAGGDSRLVVDPATGFNRYVVPPRPRPEAVHFSSSTASAVSDYGFMFVDILRRDLLDAVLDDGADPTELRRRAADAVAGELRDLLGLSEETVDLAIAPSGTDVELLTVMISLAAAGERPLVNLLIAPNETGRGVKFAGGGRFFDELSATGAPVEKGAPAWPGADISIREIALRGDDAAPRAIEAIDADFLAAGRRALDSGAHVLAHVLATSKTGLNAPSADAVDRLVGLAPDRVDVVVDACQMRSDFHDIGAPAERGWMVQISGSKFLTGPPFAGALVLPTTFRTRSDRIATLLATAPGVGRAEDWSEWWAACLPAAGDAAPPSFGPIFRWLPAILEAHLLSQLPRALRHWAFERFRAAITERLAQSRWLRPIDVETGEPAGTEAADDLSRLSIVSFQVLGQDRDGIARPLDAAACARIFELLNQDVRDRLGDLAAGERVLAAQQSHIGQPVTLSAKDGPITILRMVLGARFFTIVGHAGPGSVEASLASEISDALRAVGKLELLAAQWWRLTGR